ncbi:MAG: hypothetical protein ABSA53_39605 [Streptosporangiaceae bacterium]|jgi:hypothetical protein
MSTPHPHSLTDLALAPVLVEIERNLARLRVSEDLELALALDLNDDESYYHGPAERAARVQRLATRNVDLHHWQVRPTDDLYGLAVEHGEYTVSVMFGKQVTAYVESGAPSHD